MRRLKDAAELTSMVSVILLSACKPESRLHDQLSGTWRRDNAFEITLAPDGTFVSHWTSPTSSLTYQGTWEIQKGNVLSTLTNCIAQGTTNFQRVGAVDRWVILRADQTDLIWSNNDQTIAYKRIK